MDEIYWQDPFKKDQSEREKSSSYSSNSFESQFLGKHSIPEEPVWNGHNKPSEFSERYLGSRYQERVVSDVEDRSFHETHQQKSVTHQPRYVAREEEAFHGNQEMPLNDSQSFPEWNFLDLKNKKQTGDLYKKILYFNKKQNFKVFCFTSSRPKEGVSTILANLTDYIKNQPTGKRTMVIDANCQSPGLNKIFNISTSAYKMSDVFHNRISIRDALIPISSNIFALTNGNVANSNFGNLEPDNFAKLIDECKQLVDYVLIDCPPVLSSADSLSVAPTADISFLTVESVKVQRAVAQKTVSILNDNECEIGGVILNRLQQVIPNWVYRFI
jgi:protein-tyrosine kinase